jgi:V/A-type H+/Na+-transporting ATPase subunit D
MSDPQRQPIATRIAQLELKDEQRLVKEGYELLDEKRIRLVAEIRDQLGRLRLRQIEVRKAQETAKSALRAALSRHGIDELSVYPILSAVDGELEFARTRLFGLEILEAAWHIAAPHPAQQPVNPSPEARDCARDYRALLEPLVMSAACSLNLRRLMREYVRTERRARAIENVLLPEIERNLKYVDEQLELLDQEEIARVRQRRSGGAAGESAAQATSGAG